ncbi:MAG: hypothetical protein C0507_01285 [Cyanobacteria bacterium PR.3.49]|nr:hypothetical protein [Cyanobacteria bacterium PR.3.49]
MSEKQNEQFQSSERSTEDNKGRPNSIESIFHSVLPPDVVAQAEVSERIQIAEKPSEKPAPPEGVVLPFKDFIHKYKTPFVDAYWHSKALESGPGKSKTYEEIIEALDSSPWKKPDDLKIIFDRNAKDTFYNARTSTLILKSSDSAALQVEHVAHEGYHATHQGLKKLWFEGTKAPSLDAYVAYKGDLEVQSFITEMQVHDDITRHWKGAKPVTYTWIKDGVEVTTSLNTLFDLKHPNSAQLKKFLMFDAPTAMEINSEKKIAAYDEYYKSTYNAYRVGWRGAHAEIVRRYGVDAAVKLKLDTQKDF